MRGVTQSATTVAMGTESLVGARSQVFVEFVCLAKHREDAHLPDSYTLEMRESRGAYCARGGSCDHEWVRVPATPLELITIGKMEDRPPEPRGRITL